MWGIMLSLIDAEYNAGGNNDAGDRDAGKCGTNFGEGGTFEETYGGAGHRTHAARASGAEAFAISTCSPLCYAARVMFLAL